MMAHILSSIWKAVFRSWREEDEFEATARVALASRIDGLLDDIRNMTPEERRAAGEALSRVFSKTGITAAEFAERMGPALRR